MTYIPNKYQQEVYNFITTGTGHAVVEAVAGSGKTIEARVFDQYSNPVENQSVGFGPNNRVSNTSDITNVNGIAQTMRCQVYSGNDETV